MKKLLFATSAAFAVLLALGFNPGVAPSATHLQTNDLITLEMQPEASIIQVTPRYQTERTFLSEVYEADQEFQLLGLNWKQDLPDSTLANMEIRFRDTKGAWTDWQEIEADQDGAYSGDGFWSYIVTGDSEAFQYRAFLSTGDTAVTPKLADISFDYVNGGEESTFSTLGKLVFQNGDADIIGRDDWGADETYRYKASSSTDSSGSSDSDEEITDDDVEIKIIKTVKKDDDGNELLWPLDYPESIEKIIVHHTATTDNLDDPDQAIRAIYYYHAKTRGWGDIGYNFIIAPDGTTYEGRYGGDSVVAGHAYGYNTGSVGIALLGNYETAPPAGEMIQSLTDLIYEKSQLHGIDPDGYSQFNDDVIANVLGHKNVGSTACPGGYVYDMLDDIVSIVGASLDTRRHKNSGTDFSYSELTSLDLITLDPQDQAGVAVRIENTGTTTWDSSTFLTVNANYEADSIVTIDKGANKAVAKMKETQVKPGGTATFAFQVESEMMGGLAYFDMSPIFNGTKKTLHYMELGVYVETPFMEFDVTSEDAPEVLKPGEQDTVTVVLKNESNVIWKNSGDNKVQLKLSGTSGLATDSILTTLEESEVKPGANGTFTFDIKAPSSGGTYSLYYYPYLNNSNAVNASAAGLKVQVTGSSEDALVVDTSENLNFSAGESRYVWVRMQNTGKTKWSTSGSKAFTLSFDAPSGMTVGTPRLTMKSIAPGVATKIYFQVTAPSEAGEYTLELRPRLGGTNLTSDAYELKITVETADLLSANDYENPIRIKLTPDAGVGSPIITANAAFTLYDGEDLLKSFAANSRVRVTASGDEFQVSSGSYKWTVAGPVRITPNDEDGIVKILTMQQVASWDSSINDNRFRGTAELRFVNGEATLINELPLEDYVRGLAEETNSTPEEKLKTMAILGRSYAYYYMTQAEKFPGLPYNLDDDPATSQKYLGYGYELRHPNVAEAAEATAGTIVTYKGETVKTPYFSQSDGVATKSAQEVWGWTDTPYLVSVSDKFCASTEFWGHGVGLSGCGAKTMAEQGYSFEEIIKYYYTGVELDSIK